MTDVSDSLPPAADTEANSVPRSPARAAHSENEVGIKAGEDTSAAEKAPRDETLDLSRSRLGGGAAAAGASSANEKEAEIADAAARSREGREKATAEDDEAAPDKETDWETLKRTVEALLFAAEETLTARELAAAAGGPTLRVRRALKEVGAAYESEGRPWRLTEVAGGWRLVTRSEYYPAIRKLKTQKTQRKLSAAALETLALVAYRQPLGRAEIEAIRGVGAGPVLRQLLERRLLKIVGRGTGLGKPLLYGTTGEFLEHFGLKSLDELPRQKEMKRA